MGEVVQQAVSEGVTHVAFGDLFLAEVRAYRERMLAGTGLTPVFPLWQADTTRLAREMTASGLRAVLVCVDPKQLAPSFAGRSFDDRLLADCRRASIRAARTASSTRSVAPGPMFDRPIRCVPAAPSSATDSSTAISSSTSRRSACG